MEHYDVLIVGAGLSGIGAAHHLEQRCAGRSYAILEGRRAIGGTWDLFRYPGVRSDSDMFTLGYSFRPWKEAKAIADGPSILKYVEHTAREGGIRAKIRFGHRVKAANWSSADARWTLDIEVGDAKEIRRMSCNFLFMCSGYYRYDEGYTPEFPGVERFAGRVVHPQKWPADLNYAGKRVVVIGSGATAVTLVPAMAASAAHVTMLQRSPTYMISRPAEDAFLNVLRRWLPAKLGYAVARWQRVLLTTLLFRMSRRRPEGVKRLLLGGVRKALGPDYDIDTHFTPRYKPWDQRLCLVPDGDLFAAIKRGQASVVTDQIEGFTESGIVLESGRQLDADIIVTATGLNLQLFGGMAVSVDGRSVDLPQCLNYKGLMYSDVPNLASCFGYTNASWTLKCDLTCEYVCRLLNYMGKRGFASCVPRNRDPAITPEPWVDFSSSYFQRSMHLFPRQGNRAPWRVYQNYPRDILMLRWGRLDDGVLEFSRR